MVSMELDNKNEFKLKIYPSDENEFIGTIWIEEDENANEISNSIETVIIIDRSGSMGDATRRLTNEIIPLLLSKLSHKESQPVHLITFATNTHHYTVTAEQMKSLSITASGWTKMAGAVQQAHLLFQSFDADKPIRILSISDGEVVDPQETENAATALVEYLESTNFSINSQAVRLFTSQSQPDTKALCSLLQINNTTTSQLVDITTEATSEAIATQMAALFQSDNFLCGKNLGMESQIVLKFPWDPKPVSRIMLVPGQNVFWLKEVPMDGAITIKNSRVKISVQDPLTLIKFHHLMETKIIYILDHMKILKVVGTAEANHAVNAILNYFETKEDKLTKKFSITQYLRMESCPRKKISPVLAAIANDENIKELDSARMAEYLRGIGQAQPGNGSSLDIRSLLDRVADQMGSFKKVRTMKYVKDIGMIIFAFFIIRSIIRKRHHLAQLSLQKKAAKN